MKKSIIKTLSLVCLVATITSATSVTAFAKTENVNKTAIKNPINKDDKVKRSSPSQIDQAYLETNKSKAWIPYSPISVSDQPYGFFIEKIVYLSKEEALMIENGYRDSTFRAQIKSIIDLAWKSGEAYGGYIVAEKAIEIATAKGFTKAAKWLAGAQSGFLIGLSVEAFTGIIKGLDAGAFKEAITNTDSGMFVRVEVGRANDGQYNMKMNRYQAWNSNWAEGWIRTRGYWTNDFKIN